MIRDTLPFLGLPAESKSLALPRPQQLAALGTVLCLYRAQPGGELAGWQQAVRVEACTGLGSDGPHESLQFFDAEGRCCWRICLLPDSDFLAWDRLLESLPVREDASQAGGVSERLWRRLAGRIRGGQWHAQTLRLHVIPGMALRPVLAVSLASVSTLGAETARRISQWEGASVNLQQDDCCCERSARSAAGFSRFNQGDDNGVIPFTSFNSGDNT